MHWYISSKYQLKVVYQHPLLAGRPIGQELIPSILFMANSKKGETTTLYSPKLTSLRENFLLVLFTSNRSTVQELVDLLRASNNRVSSFFLICAQCVVFIAIVTVIALVIARVKYAQQRKELEQMIETYYQSGQALVRYVMLNRQCSEMAAYQRIKTFVKKHVPFDEQSSIDRMFLYDRQGLLDKALSILALAPNEIDKI